MMHNTFSLPEFINLRKWCIFCGVPMKVLLTTYLSKPVADEAGFPLTISALKDGKFPLNITRASDGIQDGIIDVKSGTLSFDKNLASITPYLDCFIAKNSFLELGPHVEISCPNSSCKTLYHICSRKLGLSGVDKDLPLWSISPLEVLWESLCTETSVIHNVWDAPGEEGALRIYSRHDSEVPPLEFPPLDFQELGKDRIMSKIRTMKIFA
jgi:hypothetical protein